LGFGAETPFCRGLTVETLDFFIYAGKSSLKSYIFCGDGKSCPQLGNLLPKVVAMTILVYCETTQGGRHCQSEKARAVC
jgi:hypothetical protein